MVKKKDTYTEIPVFFNHLLKKEHVCVAYCFATKKKSSLLTTCAYPFNIAIHGASPIPLVTLLTMRLFLNRKFLFFIVFLRHRFLSCFRNNFLFFYFIYSSLHTFFQRKIMKNIHVLLLFFCIIILPQKSSTSVLNQASLKKSITQIASYQLY